jgi:hypothetical protein
MTAFGFPQGIENMISKRREGLQVVREKPEHTKRQALCIGVRILQPQRFVLALRAA